MPSHCYTRRRPVRRDLEKRPEGLEKNSSSALEVPRRLREAAKPLGGRESLGEARRLLPQQAEAIEDDQDRAAFMPQDAQPQWQVEEGA